MMEGMDKETFEFKFGNELTYTTVLSDQRMVDLIPGGTRTVVHYEDRLDFIRLVQKARLEESKEQVTAFERQRSFPVSLESIIHQLVPVFSLCLAFLGHFVAESSPDLSKIFLHMSYEPYCLVLGIQKMVLQPLSLAISLPSFLGFSVNRSNSIPLRQIIIQLPLLPWIHPLHRR